MRGQMRRSGFGKSVTIMVKMGARCEGGGFHTITVQIQDQGRTGIFGMLKTGLQIPHQILGVITTLLRRRQYHQLAIIQRLLDRSR